MKDICIGIDQSYQNTGISISVDGELFKVSSFDMSKLKNNSEKRLALRERLHKILKQIVKPEYNIACVIERVRLRSKGFLNISYIEGMGALNSIIVDTMKLYDIDTYSVDTRAWKAQVIGTSKPMKNKYNVPEEKWPTVKWVIDKGFEESILINLDNSRKEKGTFMRRGHKYMYNNDAADSAGISMYWFVGNRDILKLEK